MTRRQALLLGGGTAVVVGGGVVGSVLAGVMTARQVPPPEPAPSPTGEIDEHASRAVQSIRTQMRRIRAEDFGAVGDAAHTKGYHLSPTRLKATGKSDDYSLTGAKDTVVDPLAACAIDIGMKWTGCREWVRWMFDAYAAGQLGQVVELIGSIDGKVAWYAAESTGRRRERYTGEGHLGWTHVAHGRQFANRTDLGATILSGWPRP